MPIKIQLNGLDRTIGKFQLAQDRLIEGVTIKMTELMTKLRQKIVTEKLPSSGILDPNVSEAEVAYGGGVVKGFISWLGGDPNAEYMIKPLGIKGTRGEFRDVGGGRLGFRSGHMKGAIKRFGSETNTREVLAFEWGGKQVFAEAVYHHHYYPGPAKMTEALDEMQAEIRAGLIETIQGIKTL
jgi:hypothetical protein